MTDYTAILTEAYTADFTWDEEELCELIHRLATALSTAQGEVEAACQHLESLKFWMAQGNFSALPTAAIEHMTKSKAEVEAFLAPRQ